MLIAGATGFVGQALLKELATKYKVIGLTRSPLKSEDDPDSGISWRQCDLFSLIDAEKAMAGVDYAYYLVHSMMPSARLTQGNFQDMDLILADNFARAAACSGVKQIIYLGGLIPETEELSRHLRSRLEVERTLGSHGVPVTALRAGLIVGDKGSTFRILVRLVVRYPFLIFPRWAMTLTHPIALQDVIKLLHYCMGNENTFNESFDVGGPDVMTYKEMLLRTAEAMGYKRYIYQVPTFSIKLSSILVSLLTNSPRALVFPLIESLKYPMVAGSFKLQEMMNLPGTPFNEAVRIAISDRKKRRERIKPPKAVKKQKTVMSVRSVQRLPLPPGKDADWVARYYSKWLSSLFRTIVKARVDDQGNCSFYFRFFPRSLLDLSFSADRSFKDRPLYYITGGILARLNQLPHRGRLEFREVLNGKHLLVAIHDYVPTYPGIIYSYTQAYLHVWVMYRFGRHLASLEKD